MNILTSSTPRQLQNKTKLLGFELADLLLIFLYLSISNFLFSQTSLKPPLVYIGTIAISLTLYLTKKGKPEHYLQDKLSYIFNPSIFSANLSDKQYKSYFKREIYENINKAKRF